jgi:hypothetical protein
VNEGNWTEVCKCPCRHAFTDVCSGSGWQTTEANLRSLLAQPVEPAATSAFQLEQYLSHLIPPLPSPKNASDWTEQEHAIAQACTRRHCLSWMASEWVPRRKPCVTWPRKSEAGRERRVEDREAMKNHSNRKKRFRKAPTTIHHP